MGKKEVEAPAPEPEAEVPAPPQQFTFGPEMLQAGIKELEDLAKRIKDEVGSAGERRKKASLEALGQKLTDEQRGAFLGILDAEVLGDGIQDLGALATLTSALDDWAAQIHDEAVTGILKSQSSGVSIDGLRETFATKRETVKAMQHLLGQIPGVDVSKYVIPDLRAAAGKPATGGGQGVVRKHLHFGWTDEKGTKRHMSDSQDKFSSVAFYHGAQITGIEGKGSTNGGKGIPTDELRAWLTPRLGVTVDPNTHAWSCVVEDGTTWWAEEVTS